MELMPIEKIVDLIDAWRNTPWLKIMPLLPLRAEVPMIHRCGQDWSKRTTVAYRPTIGNWSCNVGGTTSNYRIDLDEPDGIEYARELCNLINYDWSEATDKHLIASFLRKYKVRIFKEVERLNASN